MNKWEAVPMALMFMIPIVAIIGGIIAGIVKSLGRQRMIELAQKERIAAIEHGIDPEKLPPLPALDVSNGLNDAEAFDRQQQRRSQLLMIFGIITAAIGASLMAMGRVLEPHDNMWASGIVPLGIGIALLISSWAVRPRSDRGGWHDDTR